MSFEEWWENNYMNVSADRTEAEDIWDLGASSRQGEVDGLQKRIDEALCELEFPTASWNEVVYCVIKILKGNKNDN